MPQRCLRLDGPTGGVLRVLASLQLTATWAHGKMQISWDGPGLGAPPVRQEKRVHQAAPLQHGRYNLCQAAKKRRDACTHGFLSPVLIY